ncbi:MAG: helix-turn-helix domain-containing protein, partial [Rhodobacterales bacterium]
MADSSNDGANVDPSNILDEQARCLAKRIHQERIARSWSLSDLADRSGVSRAMVHRVETGVSSPTAALLGRLSGAFQISLSDLLRVGPAEAQTRLMRAGERPVWNDPETGYVREQIAARARSDETAAQGMDITKVR